MNAKNNLRQVDMPLKSIDQFHSYLLNCVQKFPALFFSFYTVDDNADPKN